MKNFSVKKHKCQEQWLCDSDFVIQCDFEEHQSIPSIEDHNNLFQCGKCGVESKDKSNLDGHISTCHELGTFFCDICPLKFPTNGDLYFHKLECHNEDEF